jgi:GNAT superfamily N-acetyltransferase
MQVTRYATPRDFLTAAQPFLLQAEVENNLILGVTADLAANPAGLISNPYFATVRSAKGICMAAFQTLPGRIAITRDSEPGAMEALCRHAHETGLVIVAVLGPDPTAEQFAGALADLRGGSPRLHMRQLIHELVTVASLPGLPAGRLRPARDDDASMVSEWLGIFQAEIGEPAPLNRAGKQRIAAGELYLWDDGGPRSMAGSTGKTPNGIRVNAVYTPREWRGHGYATATVAALSRILLDQGNRFCCLYTDLANPTSNAIYQRIGYRPVCDAAVYVLTDGD